MHDVYDYTAFAIIGALVVSILLGVWGGLYVDRVNKRPKATLALSVIGVILTFLTAITVVWVWGLFHPWTFTVLVVCALVYGILVFNIREARTIMVRRSTT